MNNDKLNRFAGEKYLNLETYRKTGTPVATPVWFAEGGGVLYVYSLANAGKVKRIRNNPRVRVAPCDMRGKLEGEWVEARARAISGDEAATGNRLLNKKYGLLKKIGNVYSTLMNRERVMIAIEID
jgi:PPOX class probable F420-dependent enzyme